MTKRIKKKKTKDFLYRLYSEAMETDSAVFLLPYTGMKSGETALVFPSGFMSQPYYESPVSDKSDEVNLAIDIHGVVQYGFDISNGKRIVVDEDCFS